MCGILFFSHTANRRCESIEWQNGLLMLLLFSYRFFCPCRCGCCYFFIPLLCTEIKRIMIALSYKWLTSFFIHDDMSCMKPWLLNIWSISQSIYHLYGTHEWTGCVHWWYDFAWSNPHIGQWSPSRVQKNKKHIHTHIRLCLCSALNARKIESAYNV